MGCRTTLWEAALLGCCLGKKGNFHRWLKQAQLSLPFNFHTLTSCSPNPKVSLIWQRKGSPHSHSAGLWGPRKSPWLLRDRGVWGCRGLVCPQASPGGAAPQGPRPHSQTRLHCSLSPLLPPWPCWLGSGPLLWLGVSRPLPSQGLGLPLSRESPWQGLVRL